MGCVFGKEISSSSGLSSGEGVVRKERENGRDLSVSSGRRERVEVVSEAEGSGENGRDQKKEEEKVGNARPPRGERKRSKPNPRLSNPPKHLHGEQVAAGWPAWLSEVAGEAINGWIPRRADTFEKLDKAS